MAQSTFKDEFPNLIEPPAPPPETSGTAPGRGRLQGSRILVVGGGQSVNDFDPNPPIGNGRATSVLLAREGATVVVADISAEAAQQTVAAINQEAIGKATALTGDASTPEGCSAIIDQALAALDGQLDGLVLNVGIVGAGPKFAKGSAEYWDRVFDVNLRSHYLFMQKAGPILTKAQRGGAIVSISSVAAYLTSSPEPAYHASKAAVQILVRNMAYELAPHVRVNSISPGLIDTPMGRSSGTRIKGRDASAVPLARQGTGWDIAYATLWLLSGESAFVTATDIVVDGGRVGTSKGAKSIGQGFEVS